jgi:hypothetical protein
MFSSIDCEASQSRDAARLLNLVEQVSTFQAPRRRPLRLQPSPAPRFSPARTRCQLDSLQWHAAQAAAFDTPGLDDQPAKP